MPQLEQTEFFLSQLFWLVILFVTLFLVLTYFTLPKIRAFLNKRENFVKEWERRAVPISKDLVRGLNL